MANIKNTIATTAAKVKFQAIKHSPEIFMWTGIVGTIASTVMACKATPKVVDHVSELKDLRNRVNIGVEKGFLYNKESGMQVQYTDEDAKKDILIIYTQTAAKIAKEYLPSLIIGTLSVGSIVHSHNILNKRNVALASSYAALSEGLNSYRKRVSNAVGEDIEEKLFNGVDVNKVVKTIKDENGNEQEVEVFETEDDVDATQSPFSRFYDDGCRGWTKDPDANLMFLRRVEMEANDKLRLNGYLFVNDLYKMLNIRKTAAGQQFGWVYKHKDGTTGYVDLGLYDIHNKKAREFVNGLERVFLMNIRPDGDILYILDEEK